MTLVDVLPDAPELAIAWLRTQADLTDLVDQRISTRSGSTITYPYLTLQRIGGIPVVPQRLDVARIQVSAWADTEDIASQVARTARAALHRMEGYTTAEAVCTAVEDDLGLAWQPDTARSGDGIRTPPTPRFIFGVSLYLHIP